MDNVDRVSFDLNASLKHYLDNPSSVPCLDADQELLDCDGSPESLTNAQINQVLDPIIDAIAENPEAITRCSVLDSMQWLLK
jgi:condensin complex subunit 1